MASRPRLLPMVAAVAVLALAAAGCGTAAPADDRTAKPVAPQEPKPLKEVSLVLDWYPNAVHSFLYVAEKEGYFAQEGLKVAIKMPAENPADGVKLVGAGKETFALYYQPDVLIARTNENVPIVSVAAVVRKPLNTIMAPKASGISSPKELAGRTVGYPSIPLDENILHTMVRTAGGDPARVKLQDIGWDLIPAIATRKVDAIIGGYLNHEKILLEKQGIPMNAWSPADFGVPNYYELVLITSEQTAKNDRATVEAFWRAAARGFDQVKMNSGKALEVLLANQKKEFPLEADVEKESLSILIPLMDDDGKAKFGAQDKDTWEKVAAWLAAEKVLKSAAKPEAAFVSLVK